MTIRVGSRVSLTAAAALTYPNVRQGDEGVVTRLNETWAWVCLDSGAGVFPLKSGEATVIPGEGVVMGPVPTQQSPGVNVHASEELYSVDEIRRAFGHRSVPTSAALIEVLRCASATRKAAA